MDDVDSEVAQWRFSASNAVVNAPSTSIRSALHAVMANLDENDERPVASLGFGDPSVFPSFRTTPVAEDAIVSALRSAKFNCYAPAAGIPTARCAIVEYLSGDLPYKLSPDDVFLTSGCTQAIEIVVSVLSQPGANILLPRPGFSVYEEQCASSGLDVRHFNLVSDREWEIDLDMVESLADDKTVAMVVINPCNPCGNVLSYQHLSKVAETAKKLGIMVIADEVYGHLTFGKNPFVPMGAFGQTVPVLTLGSLSKRWLVPGWRLGWIAATDPNGILKNTKGAVPEILKNTKDDFFKKTIETLRKLADLCYTKLQEIDCIECPHKPEGSMFAMVKLDISYLDDIQDDFEFCCKLVKEESVVILPGVAVGMKNWLRITFAIESSTLDDALDRLKSFCKRHQKQTN
ncbi:tyrosine aminotransferase [Dendrobium catenatum]|uniref:nicotianamine aminotransferase n=1 Tax=Dendrobium catenatum TaxID=906689 RepID=A0A2I0W6V7_9ASPA|nr:tyrosine aminotransferase [Dendrobium catenatum]PKU71393.1 Tyrosine aminotransferase [Dendrobium catenatum]